MSSGSNRKEAPAEPFKRALASTVRAIAGDGDLEVSYSAGRPAMAGKAVQLPEPSRVPTAREIAARVLERVARDGAYASVEQLTQSQWYAGGLLRSLARLLTPVTTRLFPDVPPDHPAMSMMVLMTNLIIQSLT